MAQAGEMSRCHNVTENPLGNTCRRCAFNAYAPFPLCVHGNCVNICCVCTKERHPDLRNCSVLVFCGENVSLAPVRQRIRKVKPLESSQVPENTRRGRNDRDWESRSETSREETLSLSSYDPAISPLPIYDLCVIAQHRWQRANQRQSETICI